MASSEEIGELRKLKVVDLREKLAKLKLPTAGLKADLVERLHKYHKENGGQAGDMEDELRFPPPPPNVKFGSPPSGGNQPPSLMNISIRPTGGPGLKPLPPHQQGPPQITKPEPPQKTALQLRLAQMAGMQTEKLKPKPDRAPPPTSKPHDQPPPRSKPHDQPPPRSKPHDQPPPRSKPHDQPPPRSKPHDQPLTRSKLQDQPPPRSKPQEQPPPRSQPPSLMSQQTQRPHHPPPQEKQSQMGHPPQVEPQADHPPQMGKPPAPPHLMMKHPPQQPQQQHPPPQMRPQAPQQQQHPPQMRPQAPQQQQPPQMRPQAPQQQQPLQMRPQAPQQQPPPQMRPQAPQQQQPPPQMRPQAPQQQPPPQMRQPAPHQQQPPSLMSQTPQPTTQIIQQTTSQQPPMQQPPQRGQAQPMMQPPPPGIQPPPGTQAPGLQPPRVQPPPSSQLPSLQPPGLQQPGSQPPSLQPPGVQPPHSTQPPSLQPPGTQLPNLQPPGVGPPPGVQPPGVPPPPGIQPPGKQPPGFLPPGVQPPPGPPQQVFQQAPQINQQVLMEKELQEKVAMQTRLLEQERQSEQQRAIDQQRQLEQQQKERLAIQQQAMLLRQQKQGPPMANEDAATGEQFMERVRQQQIMLEEQDRLEHQQQVMMEQQTAAIKQQEEDRRHNEADLLRQQQIAVEAHRDEQQQRGPPPTSREMDLPPSSGPGFTGPLPHGAPAGMRPPGPRPLMAPGPRQMGPRSSIPPLMSTAAGSIPPLMPPASAQNQIRPPPSLRPRPDDAGDGPQKQFGPTDELKEPRGMKLPSALEKVLAFKDARAQEVGMTPEELEKLNKPEEKPMEEEEEESEDEIETVEMEGMEDDDEEEIKPQETSKESKNRRRKKKKKKAKKNRLQKQTEAEQSRVVPPRPSGTAPDVTIEYVQEQLDLDPTDPNYFTFSKIFDAFKIAEDIPTEVPKVVEKPKKDDAPKVKDLDDDDDDSDDEADKEADDRPRLSKKKLKKLTRLSVAQLKQLVSRPDVVEMHDVTAQDPRLLVSLKATRNTVTVPRHWCFKRKYLQGKRGIEKAPFELPDYIQATGITEMRQALAEKEDQQTLKTKMREKVRPKMGKIDIDYQKLHDAFFRWQVKPKMTIHGDLYYEGKEFETRLKEKKPGNLSDDLKTSLGMPIGPQSEKVPPPWLIAMQRYGPPPSYPNLKIPGLNGPIPETCSFGYHAGGWGKPPVDENGKPLYGDVFGTKGSEFETEVQEESIDKSHWGEVESESESEEESSEESEGEATEESGLVTPAEGLSTPSGITSIPVGMETPDMIELRKRRIESAMDEGGDTPALYQVLPEKKTAVGAAMMGSAHVYDVSAVPAPAPKKPGEKVSTEGIEVALNPEELDLDTAAMQAKYDQTIREQQSQLEKEDLSDMVAEHAAKQKKRKKKQEESGKATKKYKEFKF